MAVMFDAYIGLLAALAMLACCAYSAYALAVRICPRAPLSARCCAAVAAAVWLQVALFEVLVSLHAFETAVAVAAWLAMAVIFRLCLSAGLGRQARSDWHALRGAVREVFFGDARLALILVGLLSTAHLLHGLVTPPLAWDSLTYQFVRPAAWVQTGTMLAEAAPDAWSYYAYFPYTGNIFWAWAMLPVHGELLLAPMGFAIWLSLLLATYTAARLLGAERGTAVLAALAVGVTPAVFAYLTAGYVDNTLLTAFLLGTVFLIRTFTGHRREALPAVAVFGLAAGVKLTGVALLGLASAPLALYLLRPWGGWGNVRQWLCAMAVGSAVVMVGVMPYLRNFVSVGSPLYPQGLRLAGVEVFAGNEQFAAVLAGEVFDGPQVVSEVEFLRATFVPGWQFTSLGPGALILIGMGALGLIVLLRRRALRVPLALMLVCAAVTVATVYSSDARVVRAHWPCTCGRFLMPALACFVLWSAALGNTALRRLLRCGFHASIGLGLLLGLPRGWSLDDAKIVGCMAVCATATGLAAWLCRSLLGRMRYPRLGTAAAVLLAAGMLLEPLWAVRRHHRYTVYRAAETCQSWVTHCLHPDYASAWPIWRYLDSASGHRIAVTAGFEDAGHNWYRYPLLGSRLQNELLYVPITDDARIINYRRLDQLTDRADFNAWIRRLIDCRVDYVVGLAPEKTIESRWMRRHPELFELNARSVDEQSRAYRFDPVEARHQLEDGRRTASAPRPVQSHDKRR